MLWTESGEFIISVMIDGLGTLVGPILGGAFFTILRDKASSFVDWYFIVIGGVLVLIVLFMPAGLLGVRRVVGVRQRPHGAEFSRSTWSPIASAASRRRAASAS